MTAQEASAFYTEAHHQHTQALKEGNRQKAQDTLKTMVELAAEVDYSLIKDLNRKQ